MPQIKRTPVPLGHPQEYSSTIKVMGVDPGFANLGIAILERRPGMDAAILSQATVIETAKASKKTMRDLRVSADDQRRYDELWNGMEAMFQAWLPQALAVEVYTPYRAQGGSAFKASIAYGLALGFGRAKGIPVLTFVPQDVKRGIAGRLTASKEDVQVSLLGKVLGLKEALDEANKGAREHIGDAAGHAYLGLGEVERMRKIMGVV